MIRESKWNFANVDERKPLKNTVNYRNRQEISWTIGMPTYDGSDEHSEGDVPGEHHGDDHHVLVGVLNVIALKCSVWF